MHDAVIKALLRWHATPATSAAAVAHTVTVGDAGQRITQLAGGVFGDLGSKSQSRAAIKKGRLRLNGQVVESSRRVKEGDLLARVANTHSSRTISHSSQSKFQDRTKRTTYPLTCLHTVT